MAALLAVVKKNADLAGDLRFSRDFRDKKAIRVPKLNKTGLFYRKIILFSTLRLRPAKEQI
jgi:hypothetical protein